MPGSALPDFRLRSGPADDPHPRVPARPPRPDDPRSPHPILPQPILSHPLLALVASAVLALGVLAWLAVADARHGLEAVERIGHLHTARLAIDRLTLALRDAETAAPAAREAALAAGRGAWQQCALAFDALVHDTPADAALHRDYEELERLVATGIATGAPAALAPNDPDSPATPAAGSDDAVGERAHRYRAVSARLLAYAETEARRTTAAAGAHSTRAQRYALGLGGLLSGGGLFALYLARRQSQAWQRQLRSLEYEATHDPLTQLPNRRLFIDCAVWGLAQALRCRRPAGVLLLDLDGFKAINDGHGHAAGDRLLVDIAARLQRCLRESDLLARIGGDEFAILAPTARTVDELDRLATRLLQAVGTPRSDAAGAIPIGLSIGIARLPEHGDDIHALLQAADTAMYAAKRAGGNAFRHAATRPDRDASDRTADAGTRPA